MPLRRGVPRRLGGPALGPVVAASGAIESSGKAHICNRAYPDRIDAIFVRPAGAEAPFLVFASNLHARDTAGHGQHP